MTNKFQNPELYKYLKAATEEASDSLASLVNKLQVVESTQEKVDKKFRKGIKTELSTIVDETIPNKPSFKSCVECLAKEEINKIIPKVQWINPDKFSAYYLEDGKARDIKGKTGLISENEIDESSDIIDDEFNELMELYREYK